MTASDASPAEAIARLQARVAELEGGLAQAQRERDEALEQQTATAEVLQAISRSTFDLPAVIQTLLDSAQRLSDAERASLWRLRDGAVVIDEISSSVPAEDRRLLEGWSIPLGHPEMQRMIQSRAPVMALLSPDDPSLVDAPSNWREYANRRGGSARLTVPLFKGQELLGTLVITRNKVRPFTERQIALMQTFADQAVIAIENARLFDEVQARNRDLAESLEQQTATAEVLQAISRSPADVQRVLDTIADSAFRFCQIENAGICRRDGDVLRVVFAAGAVQLGPRAAAVPLGHSIPLDPSIVNGRAALENRTIQVEDLAASQEFPSGRALAEQFGHHTTLAVPLRGQEGVVGTLFATRFEVRVFTEKQIALLETFADQAVIAMENARLFEELQESNAGLRESLEQQTATAEVLRIVSESPENQDAALKAVVEAANRLCGAESCDIWLPDGDWLMHAATTVTADPVIPAGTRVGPISEPGRNAVVEAFRSGRTTHTEDLVRFMEEHGALPERVEQFAGRLHSRGWRGVSALDVPLLRGGAVLGVLNLVRRYDATPKPFSPREIAMAEAFAAQAVIAIENARLFQELQARNSDLAESLEQQTATSEVLALISRSPTELEPVLFEIAERAGRLIGAVAGAVQLSDASSMGLLSWTDRELSDSMPLPPQLRRVSATQYISPVPPGGWAAQNQRRTPFAEVLRTGVPVHAWGTTEELRRRYPDIDHLRDSDAQRCRLIVPLLRQGQIIGSIGVDRDEAVPFTPRQIALMQSFADQAVIAIENARLFNELAQSNATLAESLQQQTATADVLRSISRAPADLRGGARYPRGNRRSPARRPRGVNRSRRSRHAHRGGADLRPEVQGGIWRAAARNRRGHRWSS